MEMLLLGLVAAIGIVAFVWLQRGNGSFEAANAPAKASVAYVKRDFLLTPAERSFYGVLEQAAGDTYEIHAKVRLADVLTAPKGLSASERQKAVNRISSKHLDFVLVDPGTTQIALALELDDSSHRREDRKQRDIFLESAMQSAGVSLVRVPVKSAYSVQEIRASLGLTTATQPSPQTASSSHPAQPAAQAAPTCPKCASPMVKRQANRGEHAGKQFWACSRYPECKAIVPLNAGDFAAKA